MSIDREALRGWLSVLDDLSHYEALGVSSTASYDEIRAAFHSFASTFHPDVHVNRSLEERGAVRRIFHRGVEAHRVLADPDLRARYDATQAASSAPEEAAGGASVVTARSVPPARVTDAVKTASARPFAQRAEELVNKGDLRQAKLQLVMAMHVEPHNPGLEAYAAALEERLRSGRK